MLKASDVMSRDLKEISEDATLEAAARAMVASGVSSLIIRPRGRDQPYGIITTHDIVRALAQGVLEVKVPLRA